jgi:hypothetical protein
MEKINKDTEYTTSTKHLIMPNYEAYAIMSAEALSKHTRVAVDEVPFRIHKGEIYGLYACQQPDDEPQKFAISMKGVRGACSVSKFGGICLDLTDTPWKAIVDQVATRARESLPQYSEYQWNSGIKQLEYLGEVLCVEAGKDQEGNKVFNVGRKELKNKYLNVTVAVDGVWIDTSTQIMKMRWRYIDIEILSDATRDDKQKAASRKLKQMWLFQDGDVSTST